MSKKRDNSSERKRVRFADEVNVSDDGDDEIQEIDNKKLNSNGKHESQINIKDMYLDTIDRTRLDFDFEKLCSVSLSNNNIYACLVCGKYFQGRGNSSHAYNHSINELHHVYINLSTLKVYILPDNYEVKDTSLNDIKYVLQPTFTRELVHSLVYENELNHKFDLSHNKYLPGFVGLNNIKANDYINVVLQALIHVPPIRDLLLLNNFNEQHSQLIQRLSILTRKVFNPKAFKGQVSPHELLQEISSSSTKKFTITKQEDPIKFLAWFLNQLHRDFGGSSIITRTFQGEVTTHIKPATQPSPFNTKEDKMKTTTSKFLFLTLDLPPPPLFTTDEKKKLIPQVSLVALLSKFNGVTEQEFEGIIKTFSITILPPYLILYVKRFGKNNWEEEVNPTIVNFPFEGIDLDEVMNLKENLSKTKQVDWHYTLLANVAHLGEESGKGSNQSKRGEYRSTYTSHINHPGTNRWYAIQDLTVEPIHSQKIALTEAYIQIWQRKDLNVSSRNL